jgi:hypothetical protein
VCGADDRDTGRACADTASGVGGIDAAARPSMPIGKPASDFVGVFHTGPAPM